MDEQKPAVEVARCVSTCLLVIDVFVLISFVVFSWTFGTFLWPRIIYCLSDLGIDSPLSVASRFVRSGVLQIVLLLAVGVLVAKERLVRRPTITLLLNAAGAVACVVFAAYYALLFVGVAYAPVVQLCLRSARST